jgi:hypothetical protein
MGKSDLNEKNQIKQEVRLRIKKGEPKQQILEDLSQKFKDKITIVRQLEINPSVRMKKKYLLVNIALFVLLLVTLILDIIMIPNLEEGLLITILTYLNLAIDVILLIGVGFYRIEIYSWIAARAIVALSQLAIVHLFFKGPVDILSLISLGLIIISFMVGLFMGIKLCPPRIPKTVEVEIDEKEKIQKTVYVFFD